FLLTNPADAAGMEYRFSRIQIMDADGNVLSAAAAFLRLWNEAVVPHVEGDHDFTFHDYGYKGYLEEDGSLRDARERRIRVQVRQRCWRGLLRVVDTEGLYDVRDGSYATPSFVTEAFDVSMLNHWEPIDCDDRLASRATFVVDVSTPLTLRET